MTDYVVPSEYESVTALRVRLGAYIGEGTTIMHEGRAPMQALWAPHGRRTHLRWVMWVKDRILGRLSPWVPFELQHHHFGRGNCLLGCNSIGIPLWGSAAPSRQGCITAGTKVVLLDSKNEPVKTLKARELADPVRLAIPSELQPTDG